MIGPASPPIIDYWYACRVLQVHDGDTMACNVDLGFYVRVEQPLRLLGINAPELKNPDGSGNTARVFAGTWVTEHMTHTTSGWPFAVRYAGPDKYAPRFDGVLVCGQGHCLNDAMLESGNASPMKA